ncbi:MAG: hypothetical protein ACREFP_26635 [Acetobacteraceae bacterium]
MFDLTEVGYVERIVVGSRDPEKPMQEDAIKAAVALLNRCLTETPKGKIIGIEKTFSLLNIGEHQVVLQCMIYHVGFPRKPYWLETGQNQGSTGP